MPKNKTNNENKKKFICQDCGISFSSSYNLKVHIESKCSTEKKFVCDICQSRFLTIHSLKTHINSIHNTEKKFVCSHCGKSFASKGQLTVHERSHTKHKPFICGVCNRAFSHRESLVTHSTIHTKIKPYICENCQQTFSCVGNLIKHRKIRPTTCGLPIFTNKKICKRAGVKCEKGKPSVIVVDSTPIIEEQPQHIELEPQHVEIESQQPVTYSDHQYISILVENSNQQESIIEDFSKKEMDVFDFIGIEIKNMQEQEERERQQKLLEEQEIQEQEQFMVISEEIQEENDDGEELIEYLDEHEQQQEENEDESEEFIIDEQFETIPQKEETEEFEYLDTSTDGLFKCKLCPKIYQKKNISINHLKKEHKIVIKTFNYDITNRYRKPQKSPKWKCKFCPKKYISSKMVERHEKVHGKNGKLLFKCPCCAFYFSSFDEVENHQFEAHAERLVCDIEDCKKKFDHPDKLLSHKKYSHSNRKQTTKKYVFVCTLCGRNFNTKVALSDHERSNCGKNPIYRCQYCDKYYHSAGSLKVHLTIHTAELNFECSFCPKKFRTKGQLTVHNRSHLQIKPFKCTFGNCTAEFAHRQSLETHKSIHTGIKKYECEKCSARFSCISNLLAHRRSRKKDCGEINKQEVESSI
ncbi:hypothetical protein PVAND_015028 [Polypedilum vanderplanki]|uniref:C2H2-type domain-containing protein n=1 Tax=Polypedilum vanderplanki TaxID=319348 RepID=A0A9J6BBF2_POLVA|nr:hypothetical protein PVAND_015028 [Polypedilum vanderplanki]